MIARGRGTRWVRRWAVVSAVVVALGLSALGVAMLAFNLRDRIAALRTAALDNVQWSLSQAEVDLLQLSDAIGGAAEGAVPLADLRRRFDIFFSRMDTWGRGSSTTGLLEEPRFSAPYAEVARFLAATAPLMDGDDAALRAALPAIDAEAEALKEQVRGLSVAGVAHFATLADGQREDLARVFVEVAALTAALVAALLALVGALLWLDALGRRRSEQIRVALSRMTSIIGTALDAVIVADRNGRILEFNGAAEGIFGITADRAVGRELSAIVVPAHLRAAHHAGMDRFRATGERRVLGRVRLEAQRADGAPFPAEVSISTTESDDGPIFVSFIRDLSAQVEAERELSRARDDAEAGERAKDRLLVVMSHEMRTPLNGILGTLELLSDTALDAGQRELLGVMEGSGQLLLSHVNDVLDISRIDAGHMAMEARPIAIRILLEGVVAGQEGVALARGNQLRLTVSPEVPERLMGDPVRLQQVLLNLVGNALKFTEGGEVHLAVQVLDDGRLEYRVTDSGIGILQADLDRIFEDFVTLDSSYARTTEGTGLGLGIVRRLAQAMGGEIGARSAPGRGSVFWVRLPLEEAAPEPRAAQAPPEPAGPSAPPPGARRLRVLLAEDNPTNRFLARRMIEGDGHEVVEAHHGEAAVALARDEAFDLILMDISMPRLDGTAATRAIRSGPGPCRDAPIVALTAHALASDREAFRAAGMDDVLTKPLTRASLRALLAIVAQDDDGDGGDEGDEGDGRDAAPVVDPRRLAELREDLGPEAAARLLADFLREGDALLAAMLGEGASAAARQAAVHDLAGSAALLGAGRLHGALAGIEGDLKEGRPEEAQRGIARLPGIWQATRESLGPP